MTYASGGFGLTLRDILQNDTAIDFTATDTFKVALFNNTPTPNFDTDTGYGLGNFPTTPNQITGTGYTIGGNALANRTLTVASPAATQIKFDADDLPWTTATFTAVRGCLIYDDTITTPVNDPAIVAVTFGADFAVTAGTFTIVWNANGIFYIDYA